MEQDLLQAFMRQQSCSEDCAKNYISAYYLGEIGEEEDPREYFDDKLIDSDCIFTVDSKNGYYYFELDLYEYNALDY